MQRFPRHGKTEAFAGVEKRIGSVVVKCTIVIQCRLQPGSRLPVQRLAINLEATFVVRLFCWSLTKWYVACISYIDVGSIKISKLAQ